jgi:hypothetical protein
MVEANILLRFLRDEPVWRTRLWHAESQRVWIELATQSRDRPLPPEQDISFLPTTDEIEQARRDLRQLRVDATDAGVALPGRGRLFPDVQEQAQILDTIEVWQAYVIAYIPLSLDQHVSQALLQTTASSGFQMVA